MITRLFRTYYTTSFRKVSLSHVKQWHIGSNLGVQMLEDVSQSQYKVAKIILKNPQAVIVDEDQYKDLTPKDRENNRFVPLTQQIFPQGLPDKYSFLKPVQKEFLAKIGGVTTHFYLGNLTYIYKSASEQEARRINSGIAIGRWDLVISREKLAISWAKQAALKANKQEALIVYGAGHDFKKTIKQLKDPDIVYKKTYHTAPPESPTIQSNKKHSILKKHSLFIPKEMIRDDPKLLYDALIPDCIKTLLNEQIVTLKELQSIYETKPWVIETLLSDKEIFDAVKTKNLTVDEIETRSKNCKVD